MGFIVVAPPGIRAHLLIWRAVGVPASAMPTFIELCAATIADGVFEINPLARRSFKFVGLAQRQSRKFAPDHHSRGRPSHGDGDHRYRRRSRKIPFESAFRGVDRSCTAPALVRRQAGSRPYQQTRQRLSVTTARPLRAIGTGPAQKAIRVRTLGA